MNWPALLLLAQENHLAALAPVFSLESIIIDTRANFIAKAIASIPASHMLACLNRAIDKRRYESSRKRIDTQLNLGLLRQVE